MSEVDENRSNEENQDNEIDVNSVIKRSTKRVSVGDLQKRGFKTVKVLRGDQMNELVKRAVDVAIAKQQGHSEKTAVAEAARKAYIEESRKELKKLMKERAEVEREIALQQSSLEKDRGDLVKMRSENEEMKKALEEEKARYEDELARLRGEVEELSVTIESERKEHQEVVRIKDEEVRKKDEEMREREKETEQLKGMLSKFITEYPERKESDEIETLRQEIKAMSERDSSLATQIKDLVGEMTAQIKEDLAGKIASMPAGAAGGGGGGLGGQAGSSAAKDVILDALFKDAGPLESNIDKLDMKEKKVDGVKDTLARLKNLRKPK